MTDNPFYSGMDEQTRLRCFVMECHAPFYSSALFDPDTRDIAMAAYEDMVKFLNGNYKHKPMIKVEAKQDPATVLSMVKGGKDDADKEEDQDQ